MPTDTPPPDCSMCCPEFLSYSREEQRRLRWSAWTWFSGLAIPASAVIVMGARHV